jgi:hypothetical protein
MPDNNNFINWWHLKLQIVSMGRKQFSADFQLMFRLLKLFLFIGAIVSMTLMFTLLSLTTGDIFASLLAFLPTAWAIIQVLVYFIFVKKRGTGTCLLIITFWLLDMSHWIHPNMHLFVSQTNFT